MTSFARILAVNAGSTSLKVSVVEDVERRVLDEEVGRSGDGVDTEELAGVITRAGRVDAVVHRVVHGGPHRARAARIDATLLDELRSLTTLAPLHQPPSIAGIEAVQRLLPETPAYAAFDTAFFHDLPEATRIYAVPAEWTRRYELRRYGFHGLSHAYAARRAHELTGAESLRVVTCHLGGGASLAAVDGARALDTTMGFTPLEGLVMSTRSGDVDPGLLLWLQTEQGLTAAELTDQLNHHAGVLGLTGTSDWRALEQRRAGGDAVAAVAWEIYVSRLVKAIAAMTASLGGIDALVFTGGIGEHSAALRTSVCNRLGYLGIEEDDRASRVRVLMFAAGEDLEMARQVESLGGA